MNEKSIEFRNVEYAYSSGSFTLSIESLALDMGETTFISGKSGSGKTTMSKLIAGILKPLKGEVAIMGTASDLQRLDEIGKKVGYLWQNPRQQLFAQSVLEELTFAAELKRQRMTQDEKIAMKEAALGWLEYFELAHLADKHCHNLSHGEKQRLALAAVISSGTKYLVLDEPTEGLDGRRKKMLSDLLGRLRCENSVGMCVISHDEEFAGGLKEREIALDKGRVLYVQG